MTHTNKKIDENNSQALQSIKNAARETGKKLSIVMENVNEHVSHAKENVEKKVQDSPFKSLGIAVGSGLLLGFLIGYKRR